ncbi:MAG TPA: fused MFS/spermidine synthase [Solirubrobacterales bacterium]|nr:fused MFS/spermidine synthase [Solirubrobacterales bacterium]
MEQITSMGPAHSLEREPPQVRAPIVAAIVFVVGAASLGTEIGAARLLAPFFGASTFVWANTIATVLVALATGYWLGGKLADRRPTLGALCAVIAVAAVLLAVVPFIASPFLGAATGALATVSAGAFVGSLIGVLCLVFVPVALLGAVAPFALRLSVESVGESGRVSGRLYAISTIGSLFGTFLAALLLIPLVGTRQTFLVFSLALGLLALIGLSRRFAVVPVAIGVLLFIPTGLIKAAAGEKVLYETETPYQYARVVQRPDGERWLELDEGHAIHSLYRPHSYLSGGYWDDPLILPFATRSAPPRRIAILGDAAGTMARAYGHFFPRTRIDAVEIDGALTEIGRRFFDLHAPHLKTITADARVFIRQSGPRYDAVIVDAYRQPYIPFYLTTREFFAEVRSRLTSHGVVLVNVGHPPGSTGLEKVLAATMRADFSYVREDRVDALNTWLTGSNSVVRNTQIFRARTRLPPALFPLATQVAGRIRSAPGGGSVYTDDRAPVEWLIDQSLLDYAGGRR